MSWGDRLKTYQLRIVIKTNHAVSFIGFELGY